jgi:choline-sulfatase
MVSLTLRRLPDVRKTPSLLAAVTLEGLMPHARPPRNLLFVMSDEHNKRVLGAAGHGIIHTPNLDRLAASGVRFAEAYCNSPICVPSRASFQTGRYVHNIRFWDNAIAYDGSVPSWAHRLKAAGHRVDAIGKLHFRSAEDDNGFTREYMPLHIVDGIGAPTGMLRDPPPPSKAALRLAAEAGRGDSDYQRYDDRITAAAEAWLAERAARPDEKPWCLFVSLVCPHFPLISRPEWYDLYPENKLPWPRMYDRNERPSHPFVDAMRRSQIYDEGFDEPQKVRRAIAAYFGMVSFVDDNVGRLLKALASTGLLATTRVVYTSDHGDNLGTRGLWGKSNMYEESAGVPLIMAGPEVPQGVVCKDPVSLVDAFPTIVDCVGLPANPADADLPGANLLDVVAGSAAPRTIMSEYHASGAAAAAFMIRHGSFKYVHYVGMPPQLFDLAADPYETTDLGRRPDFSGVLATCEAKLREVLDPEAVDALARADQAARIAALGGREAILSRGGFGHSPVPGTNALYN